MNNLAYKAILRISVLATATVLYLVLSGCGGSNEHDNEDHDHDHEGHSHVHHAPHGGALAMFGDHAFQLEVLPDPENGEIDLYVLNGEAEEFVRISAPGLQGLARAGEREWQLLFRAVSDAATGETVGNSSHFSARAAGLADLAEFDIIFDRIEVLGRVFEGVSIPYPEGSHGE